MFLREICLGMSREMAHAGDILQPNAQPPAPVELSDGDIQQLKAQLPPDTTILSMSKGETLGGNSVEPMDLDAPHLWRETKGKLPTLKTLWDYPWREKLSLIHI